MFPLPFVFVGSHVSRVFVMGITIGQKQLCFPMRGEKMTITHARKHVWTLSLLTLFTLPAAAQTKVDVDKNPVEFKGAQPVHKSDKVVAPVRDVAEKMGATVQYDKTDHKVTIDTPKKTDVNVVPAPSSTQTVAPNPQTAVPNPPGPQNTATPADNAQTAAPTSTMPTDNTQTTPPAAATTPAPAAPVDTTPAPAPVVSTVPATTEETHSGSVVPYVLGAIVLLGLLAYFLNRRGKTGQVIAQDDKTNK